MTNYRHDPATIGGRPGWTVTDSATGELLGFRADDAHLSKGYAEHGSAFETMGDSGFEVRDRSADTGNQILRLRLSEPEGRGGPLPGVLRSAMPEMHERHNCKACQLVRFPKNGGE